MSCVHKNCLVTFILCYTVLYSSETKVSSRIAEILSETAFSFSPNEYISIHRKLFQGIYNHVGKIRDYNITKKEWGLDGANVMYGSASE